MIKQRRVLDYGYLITGVFTCNNLNILYTVNLSHTTVVYPLFLHKDISSRTG